jgi:hypothetical protein
VESFVLKHCAGGKQVAKFDLNDNVRIRDVIVTQYKGQIGRVIEKKLNPRNRETLDKYQIRFADGNTVELWSIQLEAVRPLELKTTA